VHRNQQKNPERVRIALDPGPPDDRDGPFALGQVLGVGVADAGVVDGEVPNLRQRLHTGPRHEHEQSDAIGDSEHPLVNGGQRARGGLDGRFALHRGGEWLGFLVGVN
jgi:hypothetical protein